MHWSTTFKVTPSRWWGQWHTIRHKNQNLWCKTVACVPESTQRAHVSSPATTTQRWRGRLERRWWHWMCKPETVQCDWMMAFLPEMHTAGMHWNHTSYMHVIFLLLLLPCLRLRIHPHLLNLNFRPRLTTLVPLLTPLIHIKIPTLTLLHRIKTLLLLLLLLIIMMIIMTSKTAVLLLFLLMRTWKLYHLHRSLPAVITANQKVYMLSLRGTHWPFVSFVDRSFRSRRCTDQATLSIHLWSCALMVKVSRNDVLVVWRTTGSLRTEMKRLSFMGVALSWTCSHYV